MTPEQLALAICEMENPPSWDDAVRIAEHLLAIGAAEEEEES